jgi:hypothetical protein
MDSIAEKVFVFNSTNKGLRHSSFKSLVFAKKYLVPRRGPEHRRILKVEYLNEFEFICETALDYKSGESMGRFDEKTRGLKSLASVSVTAPTDRVRKVQ